MTTDSIEYKHFLGKARDAKLGDMKPGPAKALGEKLQWRRHQRALTLRQASKVMDRACHRSLWASWLLRRAERSRNQASE